MAMCRRVPRRAWASGSGIEKGPPLGNDPGGGPFFSRRQEKPVTPRTRTKRGCFPRQMQNGRNRRKNPVPPIGECEQEAGDYEQEVTEVTERCARNAKAIVPPPPLPPFPPVG